MGRQTPPTDPVNPWDRQEGESVEAWEAFVLYREGRSTAEVARKLGKTKQLTDRWSRAHEWVKRRDAWEAHIDKNIRQPLLEKRTADALDQHLANARLAQQALLLPFIELKRRYETITHKGHTSGEVCTPQCKRELDMSQLTQKELLLLVPRNAAAQLNVVDIERATLGLSTIRGGSKGSGDEDDPRVPALPGQGRVINVITQDPPKKKALTDGNGNGAA